MAHGIPQTTMTCMHANRVPMSLSEGRAFTCDGCEEMGYSNGFRCSNGCNYTLHKDCHMPSSPIYHPFFDPTNNRFNFQQELPPFWRNSINLCIACGMAVSKGSYISMQNNNNTILFLHPSCINLPHSIQRDGGEVLILRDKIDYYNKCQHCNQMSVGQGIQGWAYVSTRGNIACHVKCMKCILYDELYKSYNNCSHSNYQLQQAPHANANANANARGFLGGSHSTSCYASSSMLHSPATMVRPDHGPHRKRDTLFEFTRLALSVAQVALGIANLATS